MLIKLSKYTNVYNLNFNKREKNKIKEKLFCITNQKEPINRKWMKKYIKIKKITPSKPAGTSLLLKNIMK